MKPDRLPMVELFEDEAKEGGWAEGGWCGPGEEDLGGGGEEDRGGASAGGSSTTVVLCEGVWLREDRWVRVGERGGSSGGGGEVVLEDDNAEGEAESWVLLIMSPWRRPFAALRYNATLLFFSFDSLGERTRGGGEA